MKASSAPHALVLDDSIKVRHGKKMPGVSRSQVEGASKADAATLFGLSRPTFYQAEAAFARDGLAGLLPRQRGPKGAHKFTAEVMSFIDQRRQGDQPMAARALAREIASRLGLSVHPRSIERAIARKKKP